MKKQQKINRINFRCSNEDWAFYQSLKEDGLSISTFITTSIKMTNRYKNYNCLVNGGKLCQ